RVAAVAMLIDDPPREHVAVVLAQGLVIVAVDRQDRVRAAPALGQLAPKVAGDEQLATLATDEAVGLASGQHHEPTGRRVDLEDRPERRVGHSQEPERVAEQSGRAADDRPAWCAREGHRASVTRLLGSVQQPWTATAHPATVRPMSLHQDSVVQMSKMLRNL